MPEIRHTVTTDDGFVFTVFTETAAGDVDNMEFLDD